MQWKLIDKKFGRFGEKGAFHFGFGVFDNVVGHRAKVSFVVGWLFFLGLTKWFFFVSSRAIAADWQAGYEKLTDMIVPRSSQLITQDADFALFNVTLFKKVCLMIYSHPQTYYNWFLPICSSRSLKNSNFMLVRRSSLFETSRTTKRN